MSIEKTYIISQILAFCAFLISLLAYHRDKKEKILGSMVISNVLNLIHYFLLDGISGCITKIIAIFRDSFIICKSKYEKLKSNIFLVMFLGIYIVVGACTYKENIISIFPIIAAIIYIVPIWNGNEKVVKITGCLCYFLWLAYNIFVFSVVGIISNIISIVSTGIAVINYKKKEEV